MTDKRKSGPTPQMRRPWRAPTVARLNAGMAETGPGSSGETSSLS